MKLERVKIGVRGGPWNMREEEHHDDTVEEGWKEQAEMARTGRWGRGR